MLPALQIIAPLAKMLFSTIDKAIPDKDQAEKLKFLLNQQLLKSSTEELKAAASIVEAEAKSNWFVSSWRPLLMYVLIFILVWNYILGPIIKIVLGSGARLRADPKRRLEATPSQRSPTDSSASCGTRPRG